MKLRCNITRPVHNYILVSFWLVRSCSNMYFGYILMVLAIVTGLQYGVCGENTDNEERVRYLLRSITACNK